MQYNFSSGSLYWANAVELLARFPAECFDCVVTDPLYRTISGGNKSTHCPVGILKENDGKIFAHNDIKPEAWLSEVMRVMKPNTHIYVMINFFNLRYFMDEMDNAGFYIHNLLIWEKNNALPNRWYMKNAEYIIFAKKGKAKSINNPSSKTVHQFVNPRNKLHPTEKPVELMRHYIENSTQPGDVVLDPFAGSGSTAAAAILSGRRWVSIESDPLYYLGAVERLAGHA